jgi:hypothetical protein
MANTDSTITVALVFDASHAASSHWLSMAEAALDYAWPSWRSLDHEGRQSAKDQMMQVLLQSGTENPVGRRNGIDRSSPFRMKIV